MTDLSVVSYCGGGAVVNNGLDRAGFKTLASVEINPALSQVAQQNHPEAQCLTADVTKIDPANLPRPTLLWASPPCNNASKPGGAEQETDREIARSICRFLTYHAPSFFVLENVPDYGNLEKFPTALPTIESALHELGYCYAIQQRLPLQHYGIPQSRFRLILIASQHPYYAPFPPTLWREGSWYSAIADLIPTLEECELANWQRHWVKEKQAKKYDRDRPLLVQRDGAADGSPSIREAEELAPTVRAFGSGRHCHPFDLVLGGKSYRLSSRALARLQGIDNDFILPDDPGLALLAIGRAVPPPFGEAIGLTIKAALKAGGAIAA